MIKFFIFKSGKWSMADVMVVAIFMAYIGFNGIIDNQFDQLHSASQDLEIVTANGTSLQPGYYLFLTYTLLALFFSGFLARTSQADERKNSYGERGGRPTSAPTTAASVEEDPIGVGPGVL